jgi:hypothetical protein
MLKDLRNIDVPINKLLKKYDLQFTKEARSKISEVYLLTTAFVSLILNEKSKRKPFDKEDYEEFIKGMGV